MRLIRKKGNGPEGRLITGHLLDFAQNPLEFLKQAADQFGDIVHLRFGTRRVYLLNNPDHIKEVLVTKQEHFIKGRALQITKSVVGEGILTSEGSHHMRQRRLIQPAFHRQRIEAYGEDMVERTKKLLQSWTDGEERTITDEMMSLTLAIIIKTMFSIEVEGELAHGVDQISHSIDIGMKAIIRKTRSFINLPESLPLKKNKEAKEARSILDDVIYSILRERRENPHQDYRDLLSMLLAARDEEDGTGMSDQQIRDEVMTIFLAGHETTANTLSWTWYLLSQHPEVEKKFHHELDTVLAGKAPTIQDLHKLPYLHNLIWESMRFYPAVWTINRQVIREVEIGGHLFKPGETVMMSQYVMNRNRKYFENPDDFLPERFAGDLLKQLPPYAFFPFGGGPRICIGNNFAFIEAGLVLATIGQQYSLRLAPNHHPVEPEPLITMRPKNGLRMKLYKR